MIACMGSWMSRERLLDVNNVVEPIYPQWFMVREGQESVESSIVTGVIRLVNNEGDVGPPRRAASITRTPFK